MIRAHFLILRARRPVCRVGVRVGRFFARGQGIRLRMIRACFHLLCARCPVRHARVGLCRVGLRVGRFSIRSQCVRLRIRHAHLLVLRARLPVRHARRPVCRVGVRVGRFFARGQGIRLRMIRAHFLILRARCPVCYACARVRVEGWCGCAEEGGGSGTRGSIALGGGGRNGKGVAHERLLVSLRRRIAPLLRTDDGRGGVARAGPFSTLGKGDYRGMGFFILFFSILFSSGGVRIGERGRGVLLLGGLVFHFGGRALGVGRFVFHFRGFGLGSDRSGGKIARGVHFLGEGVFALGGCDCIWARRRRLLGGFGVPFGGCFLLGGGQGVVGCQAAHGTAVGFAR